MKYKELQIIKHALQYYVQRDGASEKDKLAENKLLNDFVEEADRIKNKYRI